MKELLPLALVVLLVLSTAPLEDCLATRSVAVMPDLPLVRAEGTHFEFSNGTFVTFHGVDLSGLEDGSDNFTAADFQAMANWGFNAIRLPIAWSFLEPLPNKFNASYLAEIESVVETANSYGIYVLIDMHQWFWSPVFSPLAGSRTNGLPSWALNDTSPTYSAMDQDMAYFWSNGTVEAAFASAWGYLALHLAGFSGILGYDLFNEPTTPPGWSSATMYRRMARVYDLAIQSIRAAGARQLIFMETSNYDSGVNRKDWVEPYDPDHGLVLEVHDYSVDLAGTAFQAALLESRDWDVPLFVGEFGGSYSSAASAIPLFDSYGLSWTYWCYSWTGAGGPGNVNYADNPRVLMLGEPYARLSSAPVLSLTVKNETSGGWLEGVNVSFSLQAQQGWAEIFVPEELNRVSVPSIGHLLNVTTRNGSGSVVLKARPGISASYIPAGYVPPYFETYFEVVIMVLLAFFVAVLVGVLRYLKRDR